MEKTEQVAPPATSLLAEPWLGSLNPYYAYALVVGTMMAILAVAFWLASYANDRRALRLFSLRYALAALGWFVAHPAGGLPQDVPFPSVVIGIVLLAFTVWALDEYIGHASRRRLAWTWGLAALAVLGMWFYLRVAPRDTSALYTVISAAMLWCAWLCWRASLQEPGVGYRVIAAAFLCFPLTMLASTLMPAGHRTLEFAHLAALPAIVLGVTLLVVSLRRAQLRAEAELRLRLGAESALRDLNAVLEQRVTERTAELQLMMEGLEAFTRNVSHDLRGPLGGMAGLSRFAVRALDDGDVARARHLIEAVAHEGERLQTMVVDLLTLSRVSDSELRLRPQPLRPVVEEAVRQLELTPEGAENLGHVTLEIEDMPNGVADPDLLGQVFVNLIGNAARFSASQHQGLDPGCVRVGAKTRDDETAYYVADDGPGFEPSRAGELFKPFRRLHDQRLSHNGIGLSIVKRIVERHGGRVWAEAQPGAGATFWFTLQRQAQAGLSPVP